MQCFRWNSWLLFNWNTNKRNGPNNRFDKNITWLKSNDFAETVRTLYFWNFKRTTKIKTSLFVWGCLLVLYKLQKNPVEMQIIKVVAYKNIWYNNLTKHKPNQIWCVSENIVSCLLGTITPRRTWYNWIGWL